MTATAISLPHQGRSFQFRPDGWFNMTTAVQSFRKDVYEFLRLPSTQAYLGELRTTGNIPVATQGVRGAGTWAHPKLAVFFARWLDVKFSVWCDMQIDKLLRGEVPAVAPSEQRHKPCL